MLFRSSDINQFIAFKNPFRYRSYYYDYETGLYYLNSRYYDPELGRFINADDISILNKTLDEINGLNLYAYCFNNFVNTFDDDGQLAWWKKLLIGLAFIVVGAIVTAATAGAGTGFFAALGSALLTSTIQVGISTAISAGIGMVVGGITTGTWQGALNGLIDGAIDGFMWSGIFIGSAQIIGGLLPKTSGLKLGNAEIGYKTKDSTTLFNLNNAKGKSIFRIDIAKGTVKYYRGAEGFLKGQNLMGLHFHYGATNGLRSLHRFFMPGVVQGFLSSAINLVKKIWE